MTSFQQSLVSPNSNFSEYPVLSAMNTGVQRTPIQQSPSIPLGSTRLSSAHMTGFVNPDTPIVPSYTPVSVSQTVNSPQSYTSQINVPLQSPYMNQVEDPQYRSQMDTPQRLSQMNPPSPYISQETGSRMGVPLNRTNVSQSPRRVQPVNIPVRQTNGSPSPRSIQPGTSDQTDSSPYINQLNSFRQTQSGQQVNIPTGRESGIVTRPPSPRVPIASGRSSASSNARDAVLNLNPSETRDSPIDIPSMTGSGSRGIANMTQEDGSRQNSLLFPSVKMVSPNSSLPLKPTAERII